ncbi:VapE domain-containing protein [Pelistega ratti]|uniref:VapE domain-containing protein n=1 Tax=Pelistega ratti TaxID=2652177 RepID=UPI001357FA89|nr:VapE domain-containing protein [Pelistega ratti]
MTAYKINFKDIAAQLQAQADYYVPQWLPHGKKRGAEWVLGDLDGNAGESLSINLKTGLWSDFSTGEKGGDLISLYAAIHRLQYKAAAEELSRLLGTAPIVPTGRKSAVKAEKSPWKIIMPVPADAKPIHKAHPVRGAYNHFWTYKNRQGEVLGYVCRFTNSEGKKEILPLVYAEDTSRGGYFDWRWMHFPLPRPLYGLDRLSDKPVLLVEGEKCADAGHQLLQDRYDVLTWPGGCNAVDKVDWSVLADRIVYIWPDCDSHRNPKTGEYLDKTVQPGYVAAQKIAEQLKDKAKKVYVLDVAIPGQLKDGWDIADAIESGATADILITYIREQAQLFSDNGDRLPMIKASVVEKNPNIKELYEKLICKGNGVVVDCMQNIITLIDELPSLKGKIQLNKLTERVTVVGELPWNTEYPRAWNDADELELIDYLSREYKFLFKTPLTVLNAVKVAASRQVYHPLQDWLETLKWDGQDRLTNWLNTYLGVPATDYTRLIGPLWLRQAINRALNPGCKADYVLILEGRQGLRKSTALRVLGGSWFADSPLDIHNKDLYQIINGVWIYEIAELDMFNRAEATAIKAFITRGTDRFREPYGRHVVEQARHTVFAGTTNADEYFKDTTGNRRFWPVKCTAIDIDALARDRDQLFAQALYEFEQGYPCHPTPEQERQLIQEEQGAREISDAWETKIRTALAEPDFMETKLSMVYILEKIIGLDMARVTSTRQQETKIGGIMKKLGWEKKRQPADRNGYRGYAYVKTVPS